jgi:hypothetical protein
MNAAAFRKKGKIGGQAWKGGSQAFNLAILRIYLVLLAEFGGKGER